MPIYTPYAKKLYTSYANKPAKKSNENGLDMMDKFLINATKFGLFAIFGLIVAGKANEQLQRLRPTP